MKRRKWIRRLAYPGIALAVVAVVLAAAVPWIARRQLVAILQKQIGGPVQVDRVLFKPGNIEVRGLQLFDGATPPRRWLSVDQTTIDTTFWKLLSGEGAPKSLAIDGLLAQFRLDESIHLTTDFRPWAGGFEFPFSQIDIRNARVEICLADQRPFGLDHIDLTIRGPTEAIRAEGTILSSLGGTWDLSADINGRTLATTLNLASENLPVSTDVLAELPYVPTELLERIRATGDTSVRIALQKTRGTDLQYRLAAKSRSLNITLPKDKVALTDGLCDVVLEDGVLTLHDFQGAVLGGRLALSGGLSALGPVWEGKIEGELSDLALNKLPDAWNLPAEIVGIVSGNFALDASIADMKTVLHGRAKASLEQAEVLGAAVKVLEAEVDLRELTIANLKAPPTIDGTATMRAEMEQLNLPQLVAALPPELKQRVPPVTGQLGLKIDATVPLATVADRTSYKMTGHIHSPAISYEQITLRDVSIPVVYERGTLAVASVKATLGEHGVVEGNAKIPLFTDGEITADVRCEGIAVEDVAERLPEEIRSVEATVAGTLKVRAPVEQWRDPMAWQMDGNATSPQIRFDEQMASDLAGSFALRQGELHMSDLQAHWGDALLKASGSATIASPHAFQARFEVTELDLPRCIQAAEVDLPAEVRGTAAVQGNAKGQLVPLDWRLEGSGQLIESAIGPVELDSPTVAWSITPKQIEVANARVGLFSGEVQLSAQLPLDGQTPGRASGSFRDLNPTSVAALLPSQPLEPHGTASGEFELMGFEDPATMNGTVEFRGLGVEVEGVSIQQLGGTVEVAKGRVDGEINGRAFGGGLSFHGGVDLAAETPGVAGSLTLNAMDASKLVRLFNQPALRPLRAIMDVQMELTAGAPAFEPKGEGTVILRDVSWQGSRVTNEVRSRASLTGTSLKIQGVSMGLAGGTVSGEAALRLDQPGIGTFRVNLQRVRTERLFAPWDQLAEAAKVRLDTTVRGRFAPGRVSGQGEVRLSQGHVAGVPIRDVSSSVRGLIDPARGAGEVHLRLNRGDLAGGQVAGEMNVEFGRPVSVDGRVKFTNLELQPLAQAVPNISDRLTGRISGATTVQGRNLRSLSELSGTYRLSLSDSPVLQLPVLNALADRNGIASASQRFSQTEIEGRMNRGSIDIDQMTMSASGIHMFVEGTISKRGQLNLDVTADTSELVAVGMVVGLFRPIDLIRRRLIFLNMGGTAKRPIVTLDVDRQVQQEVLLFFLPFVIQ